MHTRNAKRAYTLMEVVVVMGILFLLGVLTVAVLAPARAKSKETVCISNLHQIGQALRMYTTGR